MPLSPRSVTGAVVALSIVAGCSGSDDADPQDTTATATAEVLVTDPPATDPPPTEPPATEPPATNPRVTDPSPTEAPVTDPPATDPPATDLPTTPEGEVEAAIEFFEQQWKECLRALPKCDAALAGERLGGDVGVETAFTAELWNDNGYTASRIDDLEYRVDEVTVASDGNTAAATVCVTDPVQINEADGTPVNAAYLTSIEEYGLERRDQEWFWVERKTVGDFVEGEENSLCT